MSVRKRDSLGYLVSHKNLIREMYKNVTTSDGAFDFNMDSIFDINSPFLRQNHSETDIVKSKKRKKDQMVAYSEEVNFLRSIFTVLKEKFGVMMESVCDKQVEPESTSEESGKFSNDSARAAANLYFDSIEELGKLRGGNNSSSTVIASVKGADYIFPPNCRFFNCDLQDAADYLGDSQFDLILLDPPWYNRFVKRRKKTHLNHGYHYIGPSSLSQFPAQRFLSPEGLVAVWVTNSPTHLDHLKNQVFPSWGVHQLATWFWIKVTVKCGLVSEWGEEKGKQPYEKLVLASRHRSLPCPPDGLCLLSVPSAIHSHKPPLQEVLREYLPVEPKCLEVFARYLQSGWTSLGNQVLSMQRLSLYTKSAHAGSLVEPT